MIPREALILIRERLGEFPAVALVGSRQVGETTLDRDLAQGGQYYDLERPEERARLDLQWERIASAAGPVVLDEAQSFPDLFPRLRAAIDADRGRRGRFLVLGSISPALMRNVSESLAGRIALCELKPFSHTELPDRGLDRLWLCGGYPDGGVLGDRPATEWARSYLDLLAMRDLPGWGLPAKPSTTLRLFAMLAATHGAIWNASQLGQSLGQSYHTVNSHLDYLEQAFLVRRVRAYSANLKKRLVKSPKVYWRDSGLLHALQRVCSFDDLLVHPQVGASFEGFVIEQLLTCLSNRGIDFDGPYFLRTSDGREIDLVLVIGRRRIALEVKLSSAPDVGDLRRLEGNADLIGADLRVLVSRTGESVFGESTWSCNLPGLLARIESLVKRP